MRQIRRALCLFLFCCCLPSLTGCGKTSTQDLSAVPDAFAAQRSVCCTVEYTVGLDAVIDGVTYDDLEQSCTVDLQADLAGGGCQVSGQMTSLLEEGTSIEVEAYGDSSGSYYRYNDTYLYDEMENAFLTLLRAPAILNLSQEYTAQEATEILYGTPCTVYSGTEIADDSPQRWIGFPAAQSFSLEGSVIDVLFCVYEDSGLPACVRLDYSNLEEMGIGFSDENGGQYTLTSLRYEVLYQGYGTEVSVSVPEEFRQAALEGRTPAGDAPENGDQAAGESGQAPSDEGPDSEAGTAEGNYLLYSSDHSYSCEITTPQFMALDQQEDNAVSFYYFFAENDMELVSYTLYEDYTGDDEAAYAESLPDLYREMEGIGEVHSDGIQSLTVGAHEVSYITLSFSLEQNGALYQIMDIYSWIEAPTGQDCLEVSITEYNGSGDGLLIDPETELELAYAAVLGWHEN